MNLADPGTLKAFLGRHGIEARKGFGQHFLVSTRVVERISSALDGLRGILEIGAGPGVLTSALSVRAERMIALELDPRMALALAESAPRAEVRLEDALKADLNAILEDLPSPRGVVSNLPYYITGPLLTRIADSRRSFSTAVLMMQKEVGSRVVAKPRTPDRGSLSVFLQAQFEVAAICAAPAGAFLPPPKVDSVVLQFVPKPLPVPESEEQGFFKLIRAAFVQPRKTLANNLLGLGLTRDRALAALAAAGLGEKARPQELEMDEWRRLHEAVRR